MVVVVGEALIDRISDASGAVRDVAGGGPYNAARALASLGHRTGFIGGISTDDLGDLLAERLAAAGVSLLLPRSSHSTGVAYAFLDAGGSANYRFELAGSACAAVTLEAARQAWPGQPPRAVHVGTLALVLQPLAEAATWIVDSLDPQTLLFLDPNCRPSVISDRMRYCEAVRHVAARADVVKVSAEDLAYLCPGVDTLAAARGLHRSCGALILLTEGSAGVWALGEGFEEHIPAQPVAVVDTIGAGDVFGAAWLASWLSAGHGRAELADRASVVAAARYAVRAAAWTCGHTGAQVPTAADLRED